MPSIYITGDTHNINDVDKLSTKNWPDQKVLTKQDILIITGDFGFIWSNKADKHERYWLEWFSNKPFTTLVVDGNHENHNRLDRLPLKEMYGAPVGVIAPDVYHLKRGYVYLINHMSFFVMGGAMSTDKESRLVNITWWDRELPSWKETTHGLKTLENVGWEVDYVVTHTAPSQIVSQFGFPDRIMDPVTVYFQELYERLKFREWFFGHFHIDWNSNDNRLHCLYQRIMKL